MTEDFNLTEWITAKEAAELTGYDPAHVRLLIRQGEGQEVQHGVDGRP
jgi:hypothetical protein